MPGLDWLRRPLQSLLPQTSSDSAQLRSEKEKTQAALSAFERLQRDFQEYRKRAEQKQTQIRIEGIIFACVQMIEHIDLMSQAYSSVPEASRDEAWVEGLFLATSGFDQALKSLGMIRYGLPKGEPKLFTPTLYHAVAVDYHPTLEEGTIVQLLQRGYYFRFEDGSRRVIRPALVVVSAQRLPS